MKKIKQILGVVVIFLLVAGCYSQTLQAKESTNSEMIEDSNMELYGQAKFLDDDSIQLTPLATNLSGCVWYPHSVDTTQDFSITVSYWIGGGRELPYEGADGMILGFTEKKGIGSNGEYQGFVSREKSYGVELDSYPYNRGDPDGKHIAIIKNNVRNHLKYVLDDRVDDSAWHELSVFYKANEKTLTVYLDEKEVLSSDGIELAQKCYLGISAATASGCNQHLIKNISIDGKIGEGSKIKYSLKDTYSFPNIGERVSLKILKKFFNTAQAQEFYYNREGEDGLCHGMVVSAMASSLYSSPATITYWKDNLYDVKEKDKSSATNLSALEYVKYAYISQLTDKAQKVKGKAKQDLNGLYKAVINNVFNNGEPVTIAIRGMIKGYSTSRGHILWIIGIGTDNEKETELIVYDCNSPGEKRSVLLKKENGKYVSWEYTLWSGTTWGTGRENAKLVYYNPTKNFVEEFGKNVGYKPVIAGESKLLIHVNNASSTLLNKDNTNVTLSPDIDDDDISYIEADNVLPGQIDYNRDYLFWADTGNTVKFTAGDEQTKCGFTSDESGINLSIPQQTEANISVGDKDDNDVALSMKDSKSKYEVTYNMVNKEDGMNRIVVSGQNATQFNGKQTKEGVIVESDSLKNMKILLEKTDAEGENTTLASRNLSTDSDRILIKNDEEKKQLIVKEDADGDGKVDNDIISIAYGKPLSSLDKKKTMTIKVSSIRLSAISKQIAEGKKLTLKATVLPSNASNRKLIWKSSNPKVATVTQSGIVTLKKKTGGKKVTITATATDGSNKYASWKITSMKGVVKKVKINGKSRIKAGKTLKLKARVSATKHANKKLLWKSNNSKFATVNQKGVVKIHKKAKGKTIKITAFATDGSNKKSTIKIKVK